MEAADAADPLVEVAPRPAQADMVAEARLVSAAASAEAIAEDIAAATEADTEAATEAVFAAAIAVDAGFLLAHAEGEPTVRLLGCLLTHAHHRALCSVFAPPGPANVDARLTDGSQDALVVSMRSLRLNPDGNDLPVRPDFGKAGLPIKLRTNFFPINVPKGPIYEYDVAIDPPVNNKRLKRRIFQLAEQFPALSHALCMIAASDLALRQVNKALNDHQVIYHRSKALLLLNQAIETLTQPLWPATVATIAVLASHEVSTLLDRVS